MEENQQTPHKRRVRYKGKYPKKFEEKYKELQPGHHSACDRERKYTGGHAYFHHGR